MADAVVTQRERFTPGETAAVLQYYDLDEVRSAREYPRGSRKSPKLLLQTSHGRFLLKRRASGRDRPARVAFAHALLNHLRQQGFPVPRLVTATSGASRVDYEGRTYELFEYLPGERYRETLEQTLYAGKTLARFHRAVRGFQAAWQPGPGGYHDSDRVRAGLNTIPTATSGHDSVMGREAELLSMTQEVYEHYDEAAAAVNELGYARWTDWIIHGDWHPGNLLFDGARVVAVLDFDSARRLPAVVDVANGMLQFSILRSEAAPDTWPDVFDQTRGRRFLLGYGSRARLDLRQRQAIPHLMIESLIAECTVPIAATGSLGAFPGFGVMRMLRRKVRWLRGNLDRMLDWIAS